MEGLSNKADIILALEGVIAFRELLEISYLAANQSVSCVSTSNTEVVIEVVRTETTLK